MVSREFGGPAETLSISCEPAPARIVLEADRYGTSHGAFVMTTGSLSTLPSVVGELSQAYSG